jgi:hypothetical protein
MFRTGLIGIILTYSTIIQAQPGFEQVVVETYYIADINDSGTPLFPVPTGAITYRVYVDLAPLWELQSIYGSTQSTSGEIDTLVIRSTAPFFNNGIRGRAFGYLISTSHLDENTVLLDSWFSTGRCGDMSDGVLKLEDTNGALPSFPNLNGLLQHNDFAAGIPIHIQDGNIPGTITATWMPVGITPAELEIFDDINLFGSQFIVTNGALTSFTTPIHGPNANNSVLIGQFTTAGVFSGQLNLQLRHSVTGEIQQWVADTPGPGQFSSPSLKFKANEPPTVQIVSPENEQHLISGDTILIISQALDQDGTIASVEFFFNGIAVGLDNSFPFEIEFEPTVSGTLSAIVTDNIGSMASSDPVNIEVSPYHIRSVHQICLPDKVCMPVEAAGVGASDVIGFDMVIRFDINKIIPTGVAIKKNDLLSANYFQYDLATNLIDEEILLTVYLDASAPSGSQFSGTGELLCIEFEKRPGFLATDTTPVWIASIQESFTGGGVFAYDSIPPALFSTYPNTALLGSLVFWADESPIRYDSLNPNDYLITHILGNNATCTMASEKIFQPDIHGAFVYDLTHGAYLSFHRNIASTTDVQPVINSFDAFLVRKLLTEDASFVPTACQMIAMDVNLDGVISAGDISQINQRSVMILDEFRQVWNYHADGTPVEPYQPSNDWVFIDKKSLDTDPAFTVSSTFPDDNGLGYSRHRVPVIPACLWTETDTLPDACAEYHVKTYLGILLGDVNGNYRFIPPDGILKEAGWTDKLLNYTRDRKDMDE